VNGIEVCDALANKTSNGHFDYGIQIASFDSTAMQAIWYKLLFIGKHYWIIDVNEDFVNISRLESFEENAFDGNFQMAFPIDYYIHSFLERKFIGLFDVIKIKFFSDLKFF
jgi:hypothetical protein